MQLRRWASTAPCIFGIVFFAAAAVLALQLAYGSRSEVSGHDRPLLYGGLIVPGLLIFISQRLPERAGFYFGLGILLLTRIGVAFTLEAPLISDWARYHQMAVEIAGGGPWLNPDRYPLAPYPTGFSILLAPFYALFGPDPIFARLLNSALSMVTGWAIYRLVREANSARAGAAALTAYALSPSSALMTSVVGTETAYAAFLMLAVLISFFAEKSVSPRNSFFSGIALGISQYVRTTSLILLPSFLVAMWFRQSPRTAARLSLAAVSGFLVALIPVLMFNLIEHGRLSLVTSNVGGYSFYIGTNLASGGQWTLEDGQFLKSFSSIEEANEKATQGAIARIQSDPLAFLELAPRKFKTLWADDRYASEWAFWQIDSRVGRLARAASQIYWFLILAAAGGAMWSLRKQPPPWAVLVLSSIFTMSVVHTFLEVQPRYHAYYLPMIIALGFCRSR